MEALTKVYRIILNDRPGHKTGTVTINKAGAKIIWAAYEKLFGSNCQSMERREERGGICWQSELDYFKKQGALSKDFSYKKYEVQQVGAPGHYETLKAE